MALTLVMMISSTGQGGGQISILFRSLGRGGLGFCTHDAAVMFLCSEICLSIYVMFEVGVRIMLNELCM